MADPITPDERAAMRERYEPGPMGSPERIDIERKASQGHSARADVPRLLDALDTAEAEAVRLLAERTAAHADDATCASCTHEYVADMERRVEEAEAKVERQRDRLRAREEQVRRLRAEVTRLHELVADLRTAPVWDEDTVTEAVTRAMFPHFFTDDRQPLRVFTETRSDTELREAEREAARRKARQALAVVREHLPVSGESRATVQAEALREAADDLAARACAPSLIEAADKWGGYYGGLRAAMQNEETALRARADRLEKGTDRG